jgi:type I restriction enzyme S subunit
MTFESVKLGRVARTVGGVGFPHDYQGRATGSVPFLKVSDLALPENRNGVRTALNWVSREDCVALGARLVPAGSVLFPKVGAALLNNARALALRPVAIDNNLMAVAPRVGDSRYWMYLLSTVDLGRLSGSGPLPFVSEGQVRDLELPVASDVEVQRRIADFLDAETARIDRLSDGFGTVKQGLQERRLVQVHSLVTGAWLSGKSSTSLPWAAHLPNSWSVVKLTYVARLGSGHTPSRAHQEWWMDCRTPWITTGEVQQMRDDRLEVLMETRESISDLGLANSAAELHPAGTVVLCRTASAGYSAVMGTDMTTSQDFATWTCGPRLDPFYLLWCLRAMRPDLLGRLAMGSTHKTIYMPDIQSIRIPLPALGEQRSIVETIRAANASIDSLLDRIDRQRELLSERRRAAITAAVTGDLAVTTARGA